MLNFLYLLLIALITHLAPIKAPPSPRGSPRRAEAVGLLKRLLPAEAVSSHRTEGDAIARELTSQPATSRTVPPLRLAAPSEMIPDPSRTASFSHHLQAAPPAMEPAPDYPPYHEYAARKEQKRAAEAARKEQKRMEAASQAATKAATKAAAKKAKKRSRRNWMIAGGVGTTAVLGSIATAIAVPITQNEKKDKEQAGQLTALQTAVGASTDIASATGSLYARSAADLAALANKADAAALAAKADATRVTALETTVGDSATGLVKDVTDLKAEVNDPTTGLSKVLDTVRQRVTGVEGTVNDATTGLASKASTAALTAGLATKASSDDLTRLSGNVNTQLAAANTLTTNANTALTAIGTAGDATGRGATGLFGTVGGISTRTAALEGTVNHATTGLGATRTSLSTLEGTVNSTAIGLSATRTALGTLGGRVTTVEGTVNDASTGLAATRSTLAGKANSADLSAYATKGDVYDTATGAAKYQVAGSYAARSDVYDSSGNVKYLTKAVGDTAYAARSDVFDTTGRAKYQAAGEYAARSDVYDTTTGAAKYQAAGNYATSADLTALRSDVGQSTDGPDATGSLYARSRALGTQVLTTQGALAGKADRSDVYDSSGNARYQARGDYATRSDVYDTATGAAKYQAAGSYASRDDVFDADGSAKYQTRGNYATTDDLAGYARAGSSWTKDESDGRYTPLPKTPITAE